MGAAARTIGGDGTGHDAGVDAAVAADIGEYLARSERRFGVAVKNFDMGLSIRLSKNLRVLFGSDRLLAVVYDGQDIIEGHGGLEVMPHVCRCWLQVSETLHREGRQDRIYVEVPCRREATVLNEVLRNPGLEELVPGIKGRMMHELGHVKLFRSAGTFPYWMVRSETMAELYALARIEGSGKNGAGGVAECLATALAIGAYVDGRGAGSISAKRDDQLAHHDADWQLQRLGLTRHNYLSDGMDDDIIEIARARYAKLEAVLGPPGEFH